MVVVVVVVGGVETVKRELGRWGEFDEEEGKIMKVGRGGLSMKGMK